ncbi:hypothetical protein [Streptomyces sp. CB03238]|uniref:hypothetical protein n=1 Tax=Streptomyces sp. CB03238 TaxID=1907777 RepID=UPI000A112ADF|nr:hypothetical protein [Streptomyces sp. CB03238]ORT54184.1 hypothetical protein BKD26_35925 [Streptomyces sp. CB03238]
MDVLYRVPSPADGEKAMDIFERILEHAGNGAHRLLLSVHAIGGSMVQLFRWLQHDETFVASEVQALDFLELLAVAVSGAHTGGLVMRSQSEEDTSRVCGWKFADGDPHPLNRAEVFDAYCHDPETGEIQPPEPGVEYKDAPVIHL